MEKLAVSPSRYSYRLARDLVSRRKEEVNGIYIPCVHWPALENIEVLEEDTLLPVVTSLQAVLWHCLRKLGIGVKVEGYERLFEIESL